MCCIRNGGSVSGCRVFGRLWLVGVGAFICLTLGGCGALVDLASQAGDSGGGSGGGSGSEVQRLKSENEELRSANQDLQTEVRDLQSEVEDLQAEAAQASAGSDSAVESAESTQQQSADEPAPSSEGSSNAGSITVAGPGDTSGESAPEIMPEDFPLPSGAVLDYADEGEYNFNLDFLLDSDLTSISAFYEDQLKAQGWEEVDRTEYEQDGLSGVETSWEHGTYIPKGSPQDSDYEQTDESLTLTLQEVQPSGVGGRIFWNSYKLLDETS